MWTADIALDELLAERLIARQFPELRARCIQPFGSGWDNAAFLVDGAIVFRFPRRRIAAKLIERECRILPHVARYLPLKISVPRFIGRPSPDYPWSFAGYDLIDGVTACSVELTENERTALAVPLAEFLGALHAIDTTPLLALGLPPDEIGRLDHNKRLRLTLERRSGLASDDLTPAIDLGIAWLEAHPPIVPDDASYTLVHGDLYARHILIDAARRPTGVIDWGDMHRGDSALDLSIAFLMLPPAAHAAFRSSYGPIAERTWDAARYRAIYHAILEYDYGLRVNDPAMREIGAAGLRLAISSLT